jgi:hypothetical protein
MTRAIVGAARGSDRRATKLARAVRLAAREARGAYSDNADGPNLLCCTQRLRLFLHGKVEYNRRGTSTTLDRVRALPSGGWAGEPQAATARG